jgi:hypothetical protein
VVSGPRMLEEGTEPPAPMVTVSGSTSVPVMQVPHGKKARATIDTESAIAGGTSVAFKGKCDIADAEGERGDHGPRRDRG